MKVSVQKSELNGCIKVDPSKSLMHRYLIASFLSNSQLKDIKSNCNDIAETKAAILSIINNKDIYINESGTTLRLLLPVCSALYFKQKIILGKNLSQRPIEELVDCLNARGAKIEKVGNVISFNGYIKAGCFIIDASKSSQYVSGLLMALPLLTGDSTIQIIGDKVSSNYILMTKDVISAFGIGIKETEDGFFIKGNQEYKNKNYLMEGDWSSAASLLVAGALNGSVSVEGVNYPSLQGDSVVVDLLVKAGVKITMENNKITASKSELKPIEFCAKDCIDIVPVMAALAAKTKGKTIIHDVSRLRLKESDRLDGIINMLNKLNVSYEYVNDSLIIVGGHCTSIDYDYSNDHRILMSEIICGMSIESESIVDGVEGIAKSYPNFINDLVTLGGTIDVI